MKKKTLLIITIVISLSIILSTLYVFASNNRFSPEGVGNELKQIYSNDNRSIIVAEVNNTPIYSHQVAFKKLSHEFIRAKTFSFCPEGDLSYAEAEFSRYPLNENEIIIQIAKELVLLEAASQVGISYTDDEILAIILYEAEYIQNEIQKGNEQMMQRDLEDRAFLDALGMTRDEFNTSIYLDVIRYSTIFKEYCVYYYSNIIETSNCSFESHIDELFSKSIFHIR